MFNLASFSFRRQSAVLLLAIGLVLFCLVDPTLAGRVKGGSDPTILKIGDTYYSAESAQGGIVVRAAPSLERLGASDVRKEKVWSDTAGRGAIWAPEMVTDGGRTYIYFSAGESAAHRMYVISADSPLGHYSSETKLALPDDQWAIDGVYFVFENQGWFVWSGWESEAKNTEQSLYICRMDSPSKPVGRRYIISQPREGWEQGDRPLIRPSSTPMASCTLPTRPTAAGTTATARRTCGSARAATRPTCGTGTSRTAASSAPTRTA